MDVIDADAARPYLREQTLIEEANRMHSFEFFVDDLEDPKKAVLLECFRDDASQAAVPSPAVRSREDRGASGALGSRGGVRG